MGVVSYDPSRFFFRIVASNRPPRDVQSRRRYRYLEGSNFKIEQFKYSIEQIEKIITDSKEGDKIFLDGIDLVKLKTYADSFIISARTALDLAILAYYNKYLDSTGINRENLKEIKSTNSFLKDSILQYLSNTLSVGGDELSFWYGLKELVESDKINWTKSILGKKRSLRDLTVHTTSLNLYPVTNSLDESYISLETSMDFEQDGAKIGINVDLLDYLKKVEKGVFEILKFIREKIDTW